MKQLPYREIRIPLDQQLASSPQDLNQKITTVLRNDLHIHVSAYPECTTGDHSPLAQIAIDAAATLAQEKSVELENSVLVFRKPRVVASPILTVDVETK